MEHQASPRAVATGFASLAMTKPVTGLMTLGETVTYLQAPIPVPMALKNTTATKILNPVGWLMGQARGGVLSLRLSVAWSWQ